MKFQLLIASLILSNMTIEVLNGGANVAFTAQLDGNNFVNDDVSFANANGASASFANANGAAFSVDGAALNSGAYYNTSQNVNMAPKVYTQRVMNKPRVITEERVDPVYQKVVNQPQIERQRFKVVPQYIQQAGKVENRARTEATQTRSSTQRRTVTVAGDERHTQYVNQPSVLIQRDVLKVSNSRPQNIRHP